MAGTNRTAKEIADAYIAGETFYCFLLTGNTTAWQTEATLKDMNVMNDIVADEPTDASYSRVALTSVATSEDDTNDRAEIDCANVTFSSLAAGVGEVLGVGFERRVTNDTDSPISGVIDVSAVGTASERTPDGGDFLVTIGADGLIHIVTS